MQGGRGQEPLLDMGVPPLLPLLLLLVHTCIPGRAGSPTPALGTESDGGEGRRREKRASWGV